MLEIDVRTAAAKAAPRTEAFEAAKLRFALGIDLAAVKSFALIFFAKDLVSRVDLGKALGSLGVVLVGVGVQLFGELAKRALDRRCIRVLFYPQHFIGVSHCKFLRFGAGIR